jgi:hypothetical protein
VAEVFAGFLTGYAYSLLFTAIVAVTIINARSRVPYLAQAIAPNISPVMLAVPISILGFLTWTMFGMILGLAYGVSLDRLGGGGLGSPNWTFSLAVLLAGSAFLSLVLYAWRRLPWQALVLAGAFVALFGWAMPYLAKAA